MFSSDLEAKPQMLSKVSVLGEAVRKISEKHRARMPERFSRDVFLTSSGEPHAKHLLLRPLLDGRGRKLVSKVSVSYEAVRKKSNKHNAKAPFRAKSDDLLSKNARFGILARIRRIHRIPRKRWRQLWRRPSLTHAPGARMTVVTQTPSKQGCPFRVGAVHVRVTRICNLRNFSVFDKV